MADAYCNELHKEEILRHCNLNKCPPPAMWSLADDTPVRIVFILISLKKKTQKCPNLQL